MLTGIRWHRGRYRMLGAFAALVGLGIAVGGCGSSSSNSSGGGSGSGGKPFAGQTMVFADFGGADDVAFRKYVVEPFEKKYGGTVTVTQGLTFDILAKLNAGKGHPTVDA